MSIRQQLLHNFQQRRRQPDFWLQCLLYACLGLAFWPITLWIASTTHDQSRILHAMIVLGLATALLVKYSRVRLEAPLQLSRSALGYLIATYALLLLSLAGGPLSQRVPTAPQALIQQPLPAQHPAYGCA